MPNAILVPDLVVYHKDGIKIEEYLIGVPDLIVEVLYPGDPVYEEAIKLHACAHAGLSEYAVIDTKARTLRYYRLIELGKYTAQRSTRSERVSRSRLHQRSPCLSQSYLRVLRILPCRFPQRIEAFDSLLCGTKKEPSLPFCCLLFFPGSCCF